MKRKRIPKYRLHKSSGLAVVTINGKDHYLGTYDSEYSRAAYDKLIKEWTTCGRSRTFGVMAGVTMAMVISDYLDFCEDYYPKSSNSETVQAKLALRFLENYFDEPAAEFGPLKLKAVREQMVQSKVKVTGKPYTRQYINSLVSRICRMFRWAAENEIVSISVYQALASVPGLKRGRTPAREAPKVKPVPDDIVAKTLNHCSPIVADMIRLQQSTGMRPGEVCALTPAMIDTSGEVWVGELPEHKSAWRGKDRLIYFGPRAQEILRKYLDRAPDSALFSPAESEAWRRAKRSAARTTPLSHGNRPGYSRRSRRNVKPLRAPREHYDTSSYGRAIRYACSHAFPIPDGSTRDEAAAWRETYWWAPNRLRHSAATKIRRHHGLEAAQVLLGHSTADVTQVYAEANREKGKSIAALIG